MTPKAGYWLIATIVALALHVAVIVPLVLFTIDTSGGPGQQHSIEISLDTEGGGLSQANPVAGQQAIQSAPETAKAASPEPSAATPASASAAGTPEQAKQATDSESARDVGIEHASKRVEHPPSESAAHVKKRAQGSGQTTKSQTPATAASAAPSTEAQSAAPQSTTSHNVGASDRRSSRPGGDAQNAKQYIADLRKAIANEMQYPKQAQINNVQGVVKLHLVYDQSGNLVQSTVAKSSGSNALDQAALAMAKRASPIGRMPSSMARTRLDIVLPVEFSLRKQ